MISQVVTGVNAGRIATVEMVLCATVSLFFVGPLQCCQGNAIWSEPRPLHYQEGSLRTVYGA